MLLFYIIPLMFSAVFGLFVASLIARNRPAPGARTLAILILGASLWSTGYALEFLSPGLETKLLWAKFQYFGIATIPLAWFIFTLQYLESPPWLARSPKRQALLGIIPIVTLGLVWTNEFHGLVWRRMQILAAGPVQMLDIDHGPWFWVYLTFSYCLLLLGSINLIRSLLGALRLHRWQIRLALFATLIPWIGNLLYITGVGPVAGLDWTPFSFTVAGLLFAVSLFRFQLVNILPIAQKTVFAGLADCLVVLDLQDYIVDLNPPAQKMIGNLSEEPVGKPLDQVLPALAPWVAQASFDDEFHVEISEGEEPDRRFYDLRVTPLTGPYPRPIGRLVVCHEITQHKREQTFLEQARSQLEETVAERTRELRQAMEQLQRELAERTLAEKRFEEVVESAPDAMLLVDRDGVIILVNAQAERLFGYAKVELVGQNIETLIPVPRRNKHHNHLTRYLANPSIRQVSFNLNLSALRKDGSEFPVEISLGPLDTADGVWVACNVRDTSARMKAERARDRLMKEIKQSHEQLRALALRLQEVQEFERRQIATELHDRVGQNLTGLNLNLQIVENQLNPQASPAVRNRLSDSLKLVEETTRQVRDVMADLHPPMLDEYGLVSALHWYSGDFSQRTGIATRVIGDEFEPRLLPDVELVLFRLVQEALNNVAKHAQATQVVIEVESSEQAACLKVVDDGLGFDPQALNVPSEEPRWGLVTMQQRADSIGGQMVVDSTPGLGTQVSVTVRRSQDED